MKREQQVDALPVEEWSVAHHPANDTDGAGPAETAVRGEAVPAVPADDAWIPGGLRLPAGLCVAIAVLMVADVAVDWSTGAGWSHVGVELGAAALALGGVGVLAGQLWAAQRLTRGLTHQMAGVRKDAARWQQESRAAAQGLGEAMDRQFDRWRLTAAEREVGLLLIKGLSLREVAHVRGTSERTARQQALGLYRKAQVKGRSELAAFFLEDMLAPAMPHRP